MANGKFLVIEFDDAEAADNLKAKIDATGGQNIRVVGVHLRPEDFCRCGPATGERPRETTWIRKVGWRVCLTCMKPTFDMSWLTNQMKSEDIINPNIENIAKKGNQPLMMGMYPVALSLNHLGVHAFTTTTKNQE